MTQTNKEEENSIEVKKLSQSEVKLIWKGSL